MFKADRMRASLRSFALAATLAAGLCVSGQSGAIEAQPASKDPALEAEVMRLSAELRCLVCQNQTIADSNAELAVDLRTQVREKLQRGESDAEILDYMTARYGDFVLYRPPLKATTALLWFGPALLLVGGILILVVLLRRRSKMSADRFEPDLDDHPLPDATARTPE